MGSKKQVERNGGLHCGEKWSLFFHGGAWPFSVYGGSAGMPYVMLYGMKDSNKELSRRQFLLHSVGSCAAAVGLHATVSQAEKGGRNSRRANTMA